MNRRYLLSSLSLPLALAASLACLTGCHDRPDARDVPTPGQAQTGGSGPSRPNGEIKLTTADNVTIFGDMHVPSGKVIGAVLLLHQRGGSAADWHTLTDALNKAGIATLALDQRGHGRSVTGNQKTGELAPWNTADDVDAAVKYLQETYRGHIGIVGASYGANNGLIYAADPVNSGAIKCISLISPGANYHDLDALTAAKGWGGPIQIIYGKEDTVAGLGPAQIRDATKSKDIVMGQYDDNRHGTEMLTNEVNDTIVVFLTRTLTSGS